MMSNAPRHQLHTAKTIALTRDQLRREDTEEAPAWGTMDQAPARVAANKRNGRIVEWGIVIAATAMIGGAGLTAGAAGIGAAAYAYSQGLLAPTMVSASIAGPALVLATPNEDEVPVEVAVKTATTAKTIEGAVTNDEDASEMSLSQLRKHMAARSAAQRPTAAQARTEPTPPVRRSAPSTPAYTRTAPARTTVTAVPKPTFEDDDLDAIIHEPTASAGIASATVEAAPSDNRMGTASAPAPVSNGRSVTMPNGIIVLDQPLDPVPVAIRADGPAAVYVDGEMLGSLPMAVVLDRGSHNITVMGEKGTVAFDLDANDGSGWCFNVRKDPKLSNCR
jgi:hypothetical protein